MKTKMRKNSKENLNKFEDIMERDARKREKIRRRDLKYNLWRQTKKNAAWCEENEDE